MLEHHPQAPGGQAPGPAVQLRALLALLPELGGGACRAREELPPSVLSAPLLHIERDCSTHWRLRAEHGVAVHRLSEVVLQEQGHLGPDFLCGKYRINQEVPSALPWWRSG